MLKCLFFRLRRRRLNSELAALRLAKKLPLLATLLIGANCFFWFFLLALPTIPLQILAFQFVFTNQSVWLVLAINISLLVLGIGILTIVAPWFFGWYFIAITLMFGNKTPADKKEIWLLYELNGVQSPRAQKRYDVS